MVFQIVGAVVILYVGYIGLCLILSLLTSKPKTWKDYTH